MGRRLPPFAALRAFEAAARHNNFRRAAEELGLSPSAVSHQVKSLEVFLGLRLFSRGEGGLALSEAGAIYLAELGEALDRIDGATTKLMRVRESRQLTINLFPSLAALWLLPRLGRFQSIEPDLDVRLVTSSDPIDFRRSAIDTAIRYAREAPVEHRADRLFAEELFPVCSPRYLAEHGTIADVSGLRDCRLIECASEPGEWSLWLTHAGAPDLKPRRRLHLDTRALALGAAADGLGVALGRVPFVEDQILAGRLVAPLEPRLSTGFTYYLVSPLRSAQLRPVSSFRKWLLAECVPR